MVHRDGGDGCPPPTLHHPSLPSEVSNPALFFTWMWGGSAMSNFAGESYSWSDSSPPRDLVYDTVGNRNKCERAPFPPHPRCKGEREHIKATEIHGVKSKHTQITATDMQHTPIGWRFSCLPSPCRCYQLGRNGHHHRADSAYSDLRNNA